MRLLLLFLSLSLLLAHPAQAWWPKGHSTVAATATKSLPSEVPSWFRKGASAIAHSAQDPDVQKNRALPVMTEAEAPQHFFDLEMLQGRPIPPTRTEFYKLCNELKVEPQKVGELPYALAEWTQRLTLAFAEARRYPKNRYIQQKALVYAGILSHYAGDTVMPLHTTIHYDGRTDASGDSPKTGIHAKVDALIEKVNPPASEISPTSIQAFPNLWKGILTEIAASNTLVDATYTLEAQLPAESSQQPPTPNVRTFTVERTRAGSRFCAQLFLTAWRDSAKVQLPSWLER